MCTLPQSSLVLAMVLRIIASCQLQIYHLVQEVLPVVRPKSGEDSEEAGGKRCLAVVQRKID